MTPNRTKPTQSGGFKETIGLKTIELADGLAVMELTIGPQHLNSMGAIHGGVLATMLDNTGGLAGCYDPLSQTIRKAVTLTLTTSYVRPVYSGTIRAVARKRSGGRTIFFSSVEISDANGELVAFGEATYKLIRERSTEGKPSTSPP